MGNEFVEPVVRYGFVGLSGVLLAIVVWLTRRLLDVLTETNRVISANTQAIRELTSIVRELLTLNRSIYEKLLSRPWLQGNED